MTIFARLVVFTDDGEMVEASDLGEAQFNVLPREGERLVIRYDDEERPDLMARVEGVRHGLHATRAGLVTHTVSVGVRKL